MTAETPDKGHGIEDAPHLDEGLTRRLQQETDLVHQSLRTSDAREAFDQLFERLDALSNASLFYPTGHVGPVTLTAMSLALPILGHVHGLRFIERERWVVADDATKAKPARRSDLTDIRAGDRQLWDADCALLAHMFQIPVHVLTHAEQPAFKHIKAEAGAGLTDFFSRGWAFLDYASNPTRTLVISHQRKPKTLTRRAPRLQSRRFQPVPIEAGKPVYLSVSLTDRARETFDIIAISKGPDSSATLLSTQQCLGTAQAQSGTITLPNPRVEDEHAPVFTMPGRHDIYVMLSKPDVTKFPAYLRNVQKGGLDITQEDLDWLRKHHLIHHDGQPTSPIIVLHKAIEVTQRT